MFIERESSRSLAYAKELCDGIGIPDFSVVLPFPVLLQMAHPLTFRKEYFLPGNNNGVSFKKYVALQN